MEAIERYEQALRTGIARELGAAFDTLRLAILPVDPRWEQKALKASTYPGWQRNGQNPDGTFKFMAGIDGWATWPNGG